jgi:hypothetical protein
MTLEQEISRLRARYFRLQAERHWKKRDIVQAKLVPLIVQQLYEERFYELLINANIDDDLACETARFAAAELAEKKIGRIVRGSIMETTT